MKTIALKENNHMAAAMELSTLESLKSSHFGGGEPWLLGCLRRGVVKLLVFYFRLSYYQFLLGIRLCHMFTYAYIYKENRHTSYLLHSTQQSELGYLSLFLVTLIDQRRWS